MLVQASGRRDEVVLIDLPAAGWSAGCRRIAPGHAAWTSPLVSCAICRPDFARYPFRLNRAESTPPLTDGVELCISRLDERVVVVFFRRGIGYGQAAPFVRIWSKFAAQYEMHIGFPQQGKLLERVRLGAILVAILPPFRVARVAIERLDWCFQI